VDEHDPVRVPLQLQRHGLLVAVPVVWGDARLCEDLRAQVGDEESPVPVLFVQDPADDRDVAGHDRNNPGARKRPEVLEERSVEVVVDRDLLALRFVACVLEEASTSARRQVLAQDVLEQNPDPLSTHPGLPAHRVAFVRDVERVPGGMAMAASPAGRLITVTTGASPLRGAV
jgi:hypothetical protein